MNNIHSSATTRSGRFLKVPIYRGFSSSESLPHHPRFTLSVFRKGIRETRGAADSLVEVTRYVGLAILRVSGFVTERFHPNEYLRLDEIYYTPGPYQSL